MDSQTPCHTDTLLTNPLPSLTQALLIPGQSALVLRSPVPTGDPQTPPHHTDGDGRAAGTSFPLLRGQKNDAFISPPLPLKKIHIGGARNSFWSSIKPLIVRFVFK